MIYQTDIEFQFCNYNATDNKILLRSLTASQQTIDLIFEGVCYQNLPSKIQGIYLDYANAVDTVRILNIIGVNNCSYDAKCYCLTSKGEKYFILAQRYEFLDHDLDDENKMPQLSDQIAALKVAVNEIRKELDCLVEWKRYKLYGALTDE